MQKLTSLLILTTLCSTFAKADFYVGAECGGSYNFYYAKTRNKDSSLNVWDGAKFSALTMITGLVVGYDYTTTSGLYYSIEGSAMRHDLNHILKSQEVSGLFHLPDGKIKPSTRKASLETSNDRLYGIHLQIGKTFDNNITPFVSLGGTMANHTVNNKLTTYINEDGVKLDEIIAKFPASNFAFTAGLGMKYKINRWLFSAQYQCFIIREFTQKDLDDVQMIFSDNYEELQKNYLKKQVCENIKKAQYSYFTGEHMFKLGVAYCF